jgi:aldehyde:ferredoxin oxidoreductase
MSRAWRSPPTNPAASVGHGLGYATASRGACHLDGGYLIYLEVTGPVTLNPLHLRSKPGWVILDQNLLAAISAGGNCLFTSWTFVPKIAFTLSRFRWVAKTITWLMTLSWPGVDALLKVPPFFMKLHVPLLPHTKVIKQVTGMKMDFGRFSRVGGRGYTLERLFNLREGIGKSGGHPAQTVHRRAAAGHQKEIGCAHRKNAAQILQTQGLGCRWDSQRRKP